MHILNNEASRVIFRGCDFMLVHSFDNLHRVCKNGFSRIIIRTWYKKGEYRLKRPHGIPESSFRPGDGWSWLTVCTV
jgi:hypothetical protein